MPKAKYLLLASVIAVLFLAVAACGRDDDTQQGTQPPAPGEISGTITLATFSWDYEADQELIEAFNIYYPNVTVNLLPFDADRMDFLSAQAAIGALPDVIRSPWHEIPVDIAQGWLYPLNDLLDTCPEIRYVERNLYDPYDYNGRVYSLPTNLGFTMFAVNLDMLDAMNEDIPAQSEFTIEWFDRMVRQATTTTTSGISSLWNVDQFLPAQLDASLVDQMFNPTTRQFDLTGGAWIRTINLMREWREFPGLVADQLINWDIREAGGLDDYQIKFGEGANAVADGNVLIMRAFTWDFWWLRNLPFNWDFYTYPFDPAVGYRTQSHADQAVMLSTTEYPEAAFALLRFMTYGRNGTMFRLQREANHPDGPSFFIPATRHPEVVAFFESLDFVPNGVMYAYANLDRSVRGDHYRYVPGFLEATAITMGDERQRLWDGETDAASVAPELQRIMNDILQQQGETFRARMEVVQREFYELREEIGR